MPKIKKTKKPADRPYDGPPVKGYCLKEKKKNATIEDAVITTMANGRTAIKGKCKSCGSGMFKIGNFD